MVEQHYRTCRKKQAIWLRGSILRVLGVLFPSKLSPKSEAEVDQPSPSSARMNHSSLDCCGTSTYLAIISGVLLDLLQQQLPEHSKTEQRAIVDLKVTPGISDNVESKKNLTNQVDEESVMLPMTLLIYCLPILWYSNSQAIVSHNSRSITPREIMGER